MKHKNAVSLVGLQPVPFKEMSNIRTLYDQEEDKRWVAVSCFLYGVIVGKRCERTRRRAKA